MNETDQGTTQTDKGIFGSGVSDDPFEASGVPEGDPQGARSKFPTAEDYANVEPEPIDIDPDEDDEPEGIETPVVEDEEDEEEITDETEEEEEDEEEEEEEIEYKFDGKVLKAKKSDMVKTYQLQKNWEKKTKRAAEEQTKYQDLIAKAKEESEKFRNEVELSQNALKTIIENPLQAYEMILKKQGMSHQEAKERAWRIAQNAVRDQIAYESLPESEKMQLARQEDQRQLQETQQEYEKRLRALEEEKRVAELRAYYAPARHEVQLRMAELKLPESAVPHIERIFLQAEQAGAPITGTEAVNQYASMSREVYRNHLLSSFSDEGALEQELENLPPEFKKALEKHLQKGRLEKGKQSHRRRQKPSRARQPVSANQNLSSMSPSEIMKAYGNDLAPPD